jgi:hypothetical protein
MTCAAKRFSRRNTVSGNHVLIDAESLFCRTRHVCGSSKSVSRTVTGAARLNP